MLLHTTGVDKKLYPSQWKEIILPLTASIFVELYVFSPIRALLFGSTILTVNSVAPPVLPQSGKVILILSWFGVSIKPVTSPVFGENLNSPIFVISELSVGNVPSIVIGVVAVSSIPLTVNVGLIILPALSVISVIVNWASLVSCPLIIVNEAVKIPLPAGTVTSPPPIFEKSTVIPATSASPKS